MLRHLPQSDTRFRLLSAQGTICTTSKRHSPAVQKLLETLKLTHRKDKETTEQTGIKWCCQTNKGNANEELVKNQRWWGGGGERGRDESAQARQWGWGCGVTPSVSLVRACLDLLNGGQKRIESNGVGTQDEALRGRPIPKGCLSQHGCKVMKVGKTPPALHWAPSTIPPPPQHLTQEPPVALIWGESD